MGLTAGRALRRENPPKMSFIDSIADAINALLFEIARKLQLDDSRYERAANAYRAVGQHLAAAGAPVGISMNVYSQGSMRLQTTVRPRGREEYDLDIVTEMAGFRNPTARRVYDWGLSQLRSHPYYSSIREPKNRCVTLDYAGDFHLDVLFAVLDPSPTTDQTSILVPDRKLKDFTRSNPNGFADWFDRQCAYDVLMAKRIATKAQAPLPNNDPAHHKALLKRVVQLIKRGRDIYFGDDEDAPASIVLTTLAAQHYMGEGDLYVALLSVLERILYEIESARAVGRRLTVQNPTNNLEDFSEGWDEKPVAYGKFAAWIGTLVPAVRALHELRGKNLDDALKSLFGERVVSDAREILATRARDKIRAGQIRQRGRTLTGVAGVGRPIRDHRFHGDDGEA